MVDFEWNSVKARSKSKKHDASFEEVQSVSCDEYARQFNYDNFLNEKKILHARYEYQIPCSC